MKLSDAFSEWPPAHYLSPSELEEMELPDDNSEIRIVSAGMVKEGCFEYIPQLPGQCDCGGFHAIENCPNAIVHWNGWEA